MKNKVKLLLISLSLGVNWQRVLMGRLLPNEQLKKYSIGEKGNPLVLLQRTGFRNFPSAQKISHQRLRIRSKRDYFFSPVISRTKVSGKVTQHYGAFGPCFHSLLSAFSTQQEPNGFHCTMKPRYCGQDVSETAMFALDWCLSTADQTFLVPKGQILHFEIVADQTDPLDSPQNIGVIQAILPWIDENVGLLSFSSAECRFQQESAGTYPSWVLKF